MRRTVPAVAVAVLLLSVGCLGAPSRSGTAPATAAETTVPVPAEATTPAAGTTPAGPGGTATAAATAPETTTEWQTGFPPDERLALRAMSNLTVTVTQYTNDTNGTVNARETYDLSAFQRVQVDDFRVNGYVVISVRNATAWEGYVGSADKFVLYVHDDGRVEVARHLVS